MFNGKKHKGLTQLEQLVMDFVWSHPGCTAESCREGLADERVLKDSTIRTILRHLEEKGYLRHVKEGRAFIYHPAVGRDEARDTAVGHLVRRFFGGSHGQLALNLVEKKRIEAAELKRLRQRIKEAK